MKALAELLDACAEMSAMLGEHPSNGFFTVNVGCVENFRECLDLFRDADRRRDYRVLPAENKEPRESAKQHSATYYGDKIIDMIVKSGFLEIENAPLVDGDEIINHAHVICWAANSPEQLDALVRDFLRDNGAAIINQQDGYDT